MLVDQDDTPLFLGAIHRVLGAVTLAGVADVAAARGWRLRTLSRQAAVNALAPSTVVLTDGSTWAALDLLVPAGEAVVDVLHDVVVPALARPSRWPTTTTWTWRVRQVRRRGGVAVLDAGT